MHFLTLLIYNKKNQLNQCDSSGKLSFCSMIEQNVCFWNHTAVACQTGMPLVLSIRYAIAKQHARFSSAIVPTDDPGSPQAPPARSPFPPCAGRRVRLR